MTESQRKKLEEISKRWHNAEKTDNRQISQAIFDIGFLSGIILYLEEQLARQAPPI